MGQTLSDFKSLTKSMVRKAAPTPPPPPPKPAENELSREDQAVLDFFTHGAGGGKSAGKGPSTPKVEVVAAKPSAVLREREENFKRAELQARAEAAEQARAAAEQVRDAAVAECAAAAAAQATAEVMRDAAVAERDAAVKAQQTAEAARDEAVSARETVEQQRDAAVAAQQTAEARVAELTARVQELEAQLAAAKTVMTGSASASAAVESRPAGSGSLLSASTNFREAFAGETREMVIAALTEARDAAEQGGRDRRAMVLEAVLWANPSSGELERRRAALKQIMKDDAYRTDPAALEKLGFRLVSGRNHWKIEYSGVRMPLAKTPSDYRANLNSSADMANRCF